MQLARRTAGLKSWRGLKLTSVWKKRSRLFGRHTDGMWPSVSELAGKGGEAGVRCGLRWEAGRAGRMR